MDGMEEGGVDVVNVRPMSRVRWDERQEHPVQGGVGTIGKQGAYHNDH